jgi:hypothetical protein
MHENSYEMIAANISDEGQAQRGKDIYYKYGECGDIISSRPDDSVGCRCGNIFIDVDYVRLVVKELSKFQVLRKL